MSEHVLVLPEGYKPKLGVMDTQKAIKRAKDTFECLLAKNLKLTRVSAPLFVTINSGLNDDLNGVERPVQFDLLATNEEVQIVHSLAKWKRLALKQYKFKAHRGLYTDMNAIRRDEEMDNLHSVYVDQWDWEKIILPEERNFEYLKKTVSKIMKTLCDTQAILEQDFPQLKAYIPDNAYFITTSELEDKYPDLTPKERENAIAKEHGAVFIAQIGDKLKSGKPHDGRAPDYDDWSLNGDILIWYPVLNRAVELSSMGIRVDEKALKEHLKKAGCENRAELEFHKMLLNGELPLTIGGGIGQSRLCMVLLQKAHIGEVQASIWDENTIRECEKHGITLL